MTTKRSAQSAGETESIRTGGTDLAADQANIGGDVTGRDKIESVTVQGNVIYVQNPSAEAIAELLKVGKMSTEVPRGLGVAADAGQVPLTQPAAPDPGSIKRIDETLRLFKASDEQGSSARELQAGEVRISRVELLLKKAILLESEADEMMLAAVRQNKPQFDQPAGSATRVDLNDMLSGFDDAAHTAKLKDTYALLQEANQIDPTNTEVLLHIAQLLIQLTPDDPGDEQRVLHRIQKLLISPKNDDERFQLAQATFLLATSGDQLQAGPLSDARAMFEKLGRAEWIRQCDDLLTAQSRWAGPAPASPAPTPMPSGSVSIPAGFRPVGRWNLQTTGSGGSAGFIEIYPNGTMQGWIQSPALGLNYQFGGQWAFIPYNSLLQLRGLSNGTFPFALGIAIQGQQGNGYFGLGTDGNGYFLARA